MKTCSIYIGNTHFLLRNHQKEEKSLKLSLLDLVKAKEETQKERKKESFHRKKENLQKSLRRPFTLFRQGLWKFLGHSMVSQYLHSMTNLGFKNLKKSLIFDLILFDPIYVLSKNIFLDVNLLMYDCHLNGISYVRKKRKLLFGTLSVLPILEKKIFTLFFSKVFHF